MKRDINTKKQKRATALLLEGLTEFPVYDQKARSEKSNSNIRNLKRVKRSTHLKNKMALRSSCQSLENTTKRTHFFKKHKT